MSENSFKRIIITQGQLVYFSGSEITTYELSEYFSQNNTEVIVITDALESPIKEEFKSLRNVRVILTNSKEAISLKIYNTDLIWVHHQLVPKSILNQIIEHRVSPTIIFYHMSYQLPEEFPVMSSIENALADMVVYNSQETYEKIKERGCVFSGIPFFIMNNPAPDYFMSEITSSETSNIKRVAIVSNHIPLELLETREILQSKKYLVDIYGRAEGIQKRIDPNILKKYDSIISIGKTVQYCLAAAKPIYIYDRFGGPGYLDSNNFSVALYHNFSGRGFSVKDANTIADELLEGYKSAKKNIKLLRQEYVAEIILSKQLSNMFNLINKKDTPIKLSKTHIETYYEYSKILSNMRKLKKIQSQLNHKNSLLKSENDRLVYKLNDYRKTIETYRSKVQIINSELSFYKNSQLHKLVKKIQRKNK